LMDRPGDAYEASRTTLVLGCQPRPAVASNRDQQGIHGVLRRSRARALDRLAELYLLRDGYRGLGARRDPDRRRLRPHPRLLTRARQHDHRLRWVTRLAPTVCGFFMLRMPAYGALASLRRVERMAAKRPSRSHWRSDRGPEADIALTQPDGRIEQPPRQGC
jgi:hypothetical protein